MIQYTPNELIKMTNEDIKQLFLKIRAKILNDQRMNNVSEETKENEIYFCYIVRELQNRNEYF